MFSELKLEVSEGVRKRTLRHSLTKALMLGTRPAFDNRHHSDWQSYPDQEK